MLGRELKSGIRWRHLTLIVVDLFHLSPPALVDWWGFKYLAKAIIGNTLGYTDNQSLSLLPDYAASLFI